MRRPQSRFALATLASAFGPVIVILAAACLLFVLRRERWRANVVLTLAIGAYAWAIAAPFLSPSLIAAILTASANAGESDRWSMSSFTALALLILGWAVLWQLLKRWTSDWRIRFFALVG